MLASGGSGSAGKDNASVGLKSEVAVAGMEKPRKSPHAARPARMAPAGGSDAGLSAGRPSSVRGKSRTAPFRSNTMKTEPTPPLVSADDAYGGDDDDHMMLDNPAGEVLYLGNLDLELDACDLSALQLGVDDELPNASVNAGGAALAGVGGFLKTEPAQANTGSAGTATPNNTLVRDRLQQTYKRPAAFKQSESVLLGSVQSPARSASGNVGITTAGGSTGGCVSVDLSHHVYGSSDHYSGSDLASATPISSSAQLTQSDASSGLLSVLRAQHGSRKGVNRTPSSASMGALKSDVDEAGLKAEYVRRRAERRKKLAASKERAKEKRVSSLRDAGEKAVAVIRDLAGTTAARSKNMSEAERAEMLYRRKIRNRESAVRSRERQREVLEELCGSFERDVRDALAVLDKVSLVLEESRALQLEYDMAFALLACGSLSSPSCPSLKRAQSILSAERLPSVANTAADRGGGVGPPKPLGSTHSLPRTLKKNAFGSGSWSIGAGSDKWEAAAVMMQDTDSHASGSAGGPSSARRLFSLRASRVLQGLSPSRVGASPSSSARNAWAQYSHALLPGSIVADGGVPTLPRPPDHQK